jgi:alpha-tubulin suppressor-like RCC1 family protein
MACPASLPRNLPASVAAGATHVAVVDRNNELFVWGRGPHGQLGCGPELLECPRPHLVSSWRRVHGLGNEGGCGGGVVVVIVVVIAIVVGESL